MSVPLHRGVHSYAGGTPVRAQVYYHFIFSFDVMYVVVPVPRVVLGFFGEVSNHRNWVVRAWKMRVVLGFFYHRKGHEKCYAIMEAEWWKRKKCEVVLGFSQQRKSRRACCESTRPESRVGKLKVCRSPEGLRTEHVLQNRRPWWQGSLPKAAQRQCY